MTASRRLRRALVSSVLLAVLSTVSLATSCAAAEERTTPLTVGAHLHAMWSSYDSDMRATVMDRLAAAGARWIRVDIGWASLEERCSECESSWYVERLDEVLRQAAARDLQVLGVLWRTPGWANDSGDELAPPRDPAEFGRAAGWIAGRFAGRVAAWEIWNEPNLDDYFHGDLGDYLALLEAAAPRIRAADPNAQVVLGAPAHNDSGWIEQLYEAGARPLFDVLATHPYQTPSDEPPDTEDVDGSDIGKLTHVEVVRALMVAHGDGDKPLWFTEFGWSAHETEPGAPAWKLGVTEQQQADYLIRALELIEARYPYVQNVFWYVARDQASGDPHLDGFGLLRRDLTPKPVYHALADHLTGSDGVAHVVRVSGPDRIATSVAVSARYWRGASDVVLATADDFPDALAAGALAARLDAPILLTRGTQLPASVAAEIARLGATTAHVLGGPTAIAHTVTDELVASGLLVRRVAGTDRFATAGRAALAAGAPTGEVALALGTSPAPGRDAWPDALSAGALVASPEPIPLLLTHAEGLPQATRDALDALDAQLVTIVGGTGVVSTAVQDQLHALGYRARRLAGASRYETSAAVTAAATATATPTTVVFATGGAFPDGLTATALAAHLDATLLLIPPTGPTDGSAVAAAAVGLAGSADLGIVLGGERAVHADVPDTLTRLLTR